MWDDNNDDHPLVIEMLTKIADYLSSPEYRRFDDHFNRIAPHMYHTLVCYIFNIFSCFVKLAKNPNIVRKFKIENKIPVKEVQTAKIMINTLMEQLHLCTASSSLQMIFSSPPVSYSFFSRNKREKAKLNREKHYGIRRGQEKETWLYSECDRKKNYLSQEYGEELLHWFPWLQSNLQTWKWVQLCTCNVSKWIHWQW